MAADLPPRPAPVRSAPAWVGEGESRFNVTAMTDRAIAVLALDALLRLITTFREFRDSYDQERAGLLREVGQIAKRLEGVGPHAVPPPPPLPDFREELRSSHEWDAKLVQTGQMLSKRVKDPNDRMDSNRARAIAAEVFEGAKVAEDAKAFRAWRNRGLKVAFEFAKVLLPLAIGFAASHWGVHGGH